MKQTIAVSLVVAVVVLICAIYTNAFQQKCNNIINRYTKQSNVRLYGLGDFFAKALANDPNLPPPQNPGLSKTPDIVEIEFLPAKKTVKAYLGSNVRSVAEKAGVDIKYGCKKGECKTCEVNFNGKIVKACQASLPSTSTVKKFTIGLLPKSTPAPKK